MTRYRPVPNLPASHPTEPPVPTTSRRLGASGTLQVRHVAGRRRLPGPSVFLLFLAVFSACYAPVLIAHYGFSDDYAALVYGPSGWHIEKQVLEGRPLFALWTKLIHYPATGIEDLRYVRLAGIFGISLLACSVFRLLVRSGRRRFQSLCVAAIMCSALPFQVHAAWATTAPFPFAAFISGIAFHLGERAFQDGVTKWLPAAGAALALAAATMIYQPAAMFFWVFVAVSLLAPEGVSPGNVIRRFGRYCAIGLAGIWLGLHRSGRRLRPGYAKRQGERRVAPFRGSVRIREAGDPVPFLRVPG